MKKSYLSILLIVLAIFFTGCTSTQLEFWNNIQVIQDWEAAEVKGVMNMAMTVQGEKVNVGVDLEGTSNIKDLSSVVNMTLTIDSPLVGGTVKIKDVIMYMVEGKFAISKNYFIELLKLSSQEIPEELMSEDVDYIVMKMNPLQQQFFTALSKDPDRIKEWSKILAKIAEETNLQVDVTKKDNTYSIEMDQTQMSDIIKDLVIKGSNHLESLNEAFELGLTTEEIKKSQAEMKSVQVEMDQIVEIISTILTASLKVDYTIEDKTIIESLKLSIDEPTFLGVKMEMDTAITSKKIEPSVIRLPEKVLEITEQELK